MFTEAQPEESDGKSDKSSWLSTSGFIWGPFQVYRVLSEAGYALRGDLNLQRCSQRISVGWGYLAKVAKMLSACRWVLLFLQLSDAIPGILRVLRDRTIYLCSVVSHINSFQYINHSEYLITIRY
ncbi:unnamed protein product [Calypogeia fissa]